MNSFDQNKRKAIKLSKEFCEIIKKAESDVWIGVLEKCLNQGYEKPKRVRFRQVTLGNGYAILLQETPNYDWSDLSCDIFEDTVENYYSDISYLQSQVKYYGPDFWIQRFTNHYLCRMTARKVA